MKRASWPTPARQFPSLFNRKADIYPTKSRKPKMWDEHDVTTGFGCGGFGHCRLMADSRISGLEPKFGIAAFDMGPPLPAQSKLFAYVAVNVRDYLDGIGGEPTSPHVLSARHAARYRISTGRGK